MSLTQIRTRKIECVLREFVVLSVCVLLVSFSGIFLASVLAQDPLIEQLSRPPQEVPIPLAIPPSVNSQSTVIPVAPLAKDPEDRVTLHSKLDQITLVTRDAPLSTVLSMIAEQQGLNIVTGEEVSQLVNVTLNNVRLVDALDAILAVHGYTWTRQNNIVTISSMSNDRKTSPSVQGRVVRVFTLNYVLASDVDKVVKGLMSPLGQSFINQTSKTEQRNAHEQLVVEDLPPYLDRIAEYIAQADAMPRQVVVEANILQVTLKDNNRHGVNFNQLARVSNTNINFETMGLATGTAPASAMRVTGTDLTGLIDLLKSTSDTKTLASPKVAVLNGQQAKISVGGQLGYLLTTATQTSTLQSVSFLPYGVVLDVTPIITDDGQVLMTVAPQVSTARINSTSKLPESESTEVSTTVMLPEGQAVIIGGLIRETSNDGQNKIPFLGDLWLVGRLFQSRDVLKERNEIIITLLPRIARPGDCCAFGTEEDLAQATTPLLDRNINPIDRSHWEGSLPDASQRRTHWNWFRGSKAAASNSPPIATPSGEIPMRVDSQFVGPIQSGSYQVDQGVPLAVPTESLPAQKGMLAAPTTSPLQP
jgi:type II secretory pathway component GspD/PulD (secretin)